MVGAVFRDCMIETDWYGILFLRADNVWFFVLFFFVFYCFMSPSLLVREVEPILVILRSGLRRHFERGPFACRTDLQYE